jgi:hypothetical protein
MHNKPRDTLVLFTKMKGEGISPDAIAYTCVLAAAADLENLIIGKQIHDQVKVILPFKGVLIIHI